jgi:hypothetical protein
VNVSLFDWQDRFSAPTWFSCGVARSSVKHGRRPPAQPARSVLDGSEHDARLAGS